METYDTHPQPKKQSVKLLIALGVLLVLLILLIVLVTSASRKEKRTDRLMGEQTPFIENNVVMEDRGRAEVDMVNIEMLESFPVQARVVVNGQLPDGCTEISTSSIDYDEASHTFMLELRTQRPIDAVCTEALVPYTEFIPLDIVGLAAGTYTVDVNGVTNTFTLAIDNEEMYDLDKG